MTESHRLQGLHHSSLGFEVDDRDGLMHALIQATSPPGLRRLREPNKLMQSATTTIDFGPKHWSLFVDALSTEMDSSLIYWDKYPLHQQWANFHVGSPMPTRKQQLVSFIYWLPYGYKVASLLRRILRR